MMPLIVHCAAPALDETGFTASARLNTFVKSARICKFTLPSCMGKFRPRLGLSGDASGNDSHRNNPPNCPTSPVSQENAWANS